MDSAKIERRPGPPSTRSREGIRSREGLRRPCIGLEAEFTLYVDGRKQRPEKVFGNPRHMIREKMIPRPGRSWQLPTGGALYFDTGVIEVATPVHEIGPGCAARAVHCLWEQIAFVRSELDAWEAKHGVSIRLEGFSTHYNISIPPDAAHGPICARLALLLTYLLHAPVMLLAANKRSTGIGVRPRDGRVEVTADFTPDPNLMEAAATFIAGVSLAVAQWEEYGIEQLAARKFPVVAGFAPCPHTSRKGFLARFDCFPANPFAADPNEESWITADGRTLSLRQIACAVAAKFRGSIRAMGDASVSRHLFAVLAGRARSLLDFPDRPASYEDVGRSIRWNRRSKRALPQACYEHIIRNVIKHRPLRIGASTYLPERILGWFEIAFRNTKTGRRRVFSLDDLIGNAEC
jgi:hypothetical protein